MTVKRRERNKLTILEGKILTHYFHPMEAAEHGNGDGQNETTSGEEKAKNDEEGAPGEQQDDIEDKIKEESKFTGHYQRAPPVNCTEKIVFFLDISAEMGTTTWYQGRGRPSPLINSVQKILRTFLATKTTLNAEHEYALALVQGNTIIWCQDFSADSRQFCEIISAIEIAEKTEQDEESLDFGEVVKILYEYCKVPVLQDLILPPPYIVRCIFIFGRSNCELTISQDKRELLDAMKRSPYFFLDVLYLHDPPSQENKAKDIYEFFCNLDKEEKGYILEVSNNLKLLHETLAKLIGHPLQRSHQSEACYDLVEIPMGEAAAVPS